MKLKRFGSIRVRITALTLILMTTGLVITSAAAYIAVENLLIDRQEAVVSHVLNRSMALPRFEVLNLTSDALVQSVPDDVFLAVFDDKNQTLFGHQVVMSSSDDQFELPNFSELTSEPMRVSSDSGNEVLLLQKRTLAPDEQVAIIFNGEARTIASGVAGVLITSDLALLNNLLAIQIGFSLLVLAATFVAMSRVSRFSLKPLRDVAQTAEQLSVNGFSTRIAIDNKETEIGVMSTVLNNTFDKMQSTNERMQDFVADASHELRTPLASIHGWVDLYANEGIRTWPEVDEAMLRIHSESSRMIRLVEQLLVLARLDNEDTAREVECEVFEVCTRVVTNVRMVASGHVILFENLEAQKIVASLTDDELSRVISNLLVNATKHTPPGSKISLVVEPPSIARPTISITVSDNGPGMTEAERAKALDRFWRADKSRNSDGGAGLGLAIVDEIVRARGGSIDLSSNRLGGLDVRVLLNPSSGDQAVV